MLSRPTFPQAAAAPGHGSRSAAATCNAIHRVQTQTNVREPYPPLIYTYMYEEKPPIADSRHFPLSDKLSAEYEITDSYWVSPLHLYA